MQGFLSNSRWKQLKLMRTYGIGLQLDLLSTVNPRALRKHSQVKSQVSTMCVYGVARSTHTSTLDHSLLDPDMTSLWIEGEWESSWAIWMKLTSNIVYGLLTLEG